MGTCCGSYATEPDPSDEYSLSSTSDRVTAKMLVGERFETGGSQYVIDSAFDDILEDQYVKCRRTDDEKSDNVNTPNEFFLTVSQLKHVTHLNEDNEEEKLLGFEIEQKEAAHSTITINESEQGRTGNDIAGEELDKTEDDPDASGFECVLLAISKVINFTLLSITVIHIFATLCIMNCCCDTAHIPQGPLGCPNCKVFMNIAWGINAITTAVIVSYYGFIYSGVYDEYQPWMCAYVSWIAIIWIQFILDVVIGEYSRRKLKVLSYFQMKIVGITMTKKKRLYEDRFKDHWMVAISSMLPAMAVFFVASYIIEEKFVLKCSASLKSGDICYNDGKGCCVVVSSHDIENAADFLARLASHMLAIFAIIRVIAWFMLSRYKEIKDIARKSR